MKNDPYIKIIEALPGVRPTEEWLIEMLATKKANESYYIDAPLKELKLAYDKIYKLIRKGIRPPEGGRWIINRIGASYHKKKLGEQNFKIWSMVSDQGWDTTQTLKKRIERHPETLNEVVEIVKWSREQTLKILNAKRNGGFQRAGTTNKKTNDFENQLKGYWHKPYKEIIKYITEKNLFSEIPPATLEKRIRAGIKKNSKK
jgi:hypothetical protein